MAKPGDVVSAGDVLVVVEAMKMEHPVVAKITGRLQELHCAVGDQVQAEQILGQIEEPEA